MRPDEVLAILRHEKLTLDAAMGTALFERGLAGRAPAWNLERPAEVLAVHRGHVAAGAQMVLTNTFAGASPEEAEAALRIARESGARLVGASIYAGLPDLEQQIEQLSGADCLWLETAISAQMALDAVVRAAPFALPIVITCAMRKAPLDELRSLGAALAGYNCSPWPDDAGRADVLKLDGAGLPPAAWARAVPRARVLGGCCGTTAAHLAALIREDEARRSPMTIRECRPEDLPVVLEIVNDAAQAYAGVIPADCWHEPYMAMPELERETRDGVRFWAFQDGAAIAGVMGIQDRGDVELIRHAYVRTAKRSHGIGRVLLAHLQAMTTKPVLVGTWAAATWAIRFYEQNGYRLLPREDTIRLLKKYWRISERQIETSVVLASRSWQP